MLFNSPEFIFCFLPVVWLLFFGIARFSHTIALASLALSSLFFYAWWNWHFLPILLISTLFNFTAGYFLSKNPPHKGKILAGAITINLVGLFFYKYVNLAILSINSLSGLTIEQPNIALPLGISFFTFTQIAFLVDVYYQKAKEPNIVNYGLFVSYFPHLIAGPILHHSQMMPQFRDSSIFTPKAHSVVLGLVFLTIGLIKKIFLADNIAPYSTLVFTASAAGQTLNFYEAWVGAFSYTLQIYFDFSGYCDMAIGISLLFNIHLPLNFASPYKSQSITEFWRAWHMTLSQFLRDYLYIPLGGNRLGKLRRYINLFLTMLLGGLWHGANWTFVIWGALHGLYLIINHSYTSVRQSLGWRQMPKPLGITITLFAVVFAWVPFRAENWSSTLNIWQSMLSLDQLWHTTAQATHLNCARITRGIVLAFILIMFAPNSQTIVDNIRQRLNKDLPQSQAKYWLGFGLVLGLLFAYTIASLGHVSEFLYFQF